MYILSVDPGVERIGISVFKKNVDKTAIFLLSQTIKTDRKHDHQKRLHELYNNLQPMIKKFKPHIIVMERLFFFKNEKTVIQVAQAQGVIFLLADQNNIPCEYLTPLQIKSAVTGYGNADKKAVKKMLQLQLAIDLSKKIDDEIDAIACGYAYCVNSHPFFQ